MKQTLLAVAVGCAVWAGAGEELGGQVIVGAQGSYVSRVVDGTFALGGKASVSLGRLVPGLELQGAVDYLFPDCPVADCTFWDVTGAVLLGGGPGGYVGLGAGYQSRDVTQDGSSGSVLEVQDEWAFYILTGLRLEATPHILPFLEAKLEVGDDVNQQVLSLGVAFRLGEAPRRPGRGGLTGPDR